MDEAGREEFRERMGKVEIGGRDLEEGRIEVEKRIKEALEEVEKKRGEGGEKKEGLKEKKG